MATSLEFSTSAFPSEIGRLKFHRHAMLASLIIDLAAAVVCTWPCNVVHGPHGRDQTVKLNY